MDSAHHTRGGHPFRQEGSILCIPFLKLKSPCSGFLKRASGTGELAEVPSPSGGMTCRHPRVSLTFTEAPLAFLKAWLESPRNLVLDRIRETTSFRSREHFEMKEKATRESGPDPRPALDGGSQPWGDFLLTQPAPSGSSQERRKRQLRSLELASLAPLPTPFSLRVFVELLHMQFVSYRETNSSVIPSPDSRQIHYIIQAVLAEFCSLALPPTPGHQPPGGRWEKESCRHRKLETMDN